jgi:hypothetical protein
VAQSVTLAVDGTNYDLFDGDTTITARKASDFVDKWTYARIGIDIDLSNMIAGDTVTLEILKAIDGTNYRSVTGQVVYTGVQTPPSDSYEIVTNGGFDIKAQIKRTGGASRVIEVLYWAVGGE